MTSRASNGLSIKIKHKFCISDDEKRWAHEIFFKRNAKPIKAPNSTHKNHHYGGDYKA